jgi:hypothetical protein
MAATPIFRSLAWTSTSFERPKLRRSWRLNVACRPSALNKQLDGRRHPMTASICQAEVSSTTRTRRSVHHADSTVGLDLAQNVFQVQGANAHGKGVLRKQLQRDQVAAFFANLPACLISMKACSSAHHWARKLQVLSRAQRKSCCANRVRFGRSARRRCLGLRHRAVPEAAPAGLQAGDNRRRPRQQDGLSSIPSGQVHDQRR